MPFFKNLENKICQVYDTEVEPVIEAGWKELTADEEAAYRDGLAAAHHLTSAAEIEAARVEAGVYKLFGEAKTETEQAVETEAPKLAEDAEKAVETATDTAAEEAAGEGSDSEEDKPAEGEATDSEESAEQPTTEGDAAPETEATAPAEDAGETAAEEAAGEGSDNAA